MCKLAKKTTNRWAKKRFEKVVEFELDCKGQEVALVVKNPPDNAGDVRDSGSIPGSGRPPGEGHGNPLQYSCLEDPMDRGAWWATVPGVSESQSDVP